MKREDINYPKFKDQFAVIDFDAEPMPVLSLFPLPKATPLQEWTLLLTDVMGQRCLLSGIMGGAGPGQPPGRPARPGWPWSPICFKEFGDEAGQQPH